MMGWVGHVAHVRETVMEEKLRDLTVDRRMMLNWVTEIRCGMDSAAKE